MTRDIGIHAVGVGLQRGAHDRRVRVERPLRGASQPDRLQFHVTRQGPRAEQFGERSARLATQHVDLEQPVLRGDPPLQEDRIVLVERVDVGHAVDVTQDLSGSMQLRQVDALGLDLSRWIRAGEGNRGGEHRAQGHEKCEAHGQSPGCSAITGNKPIAG